MTSCRRSVLITTFCLLTISAAHAAGWVSANERLVEATYAGDLAGYRKAIEAGAWVTTRDDGGNGLAAIAAAMGQGDILRDLIQSGAPVDGVGNLGDSALGFACAYGDTAMIAALLNANADVAKADVKGDPPLVEAILSGNPKAVELMLGKGQADPNQSSGELRMTPLMIAAKNGHAEIIRVLLDRRADLERRDFLGETALYWAIHENKKEVVEVLRASGANLNDVISGHSALQVAIGEDQEEIAEYLRNY